MDFVPPLIITLTILTLCCVLLLLAYQLITTKFSSGNSRKKKNKKESVKKSHPELNRVIKNPVISPFVEHAWSAGGTFNPAAFKDKEGRVHLIYRAVGADGISRLGYSASEDGLSFDDHMPYPVFTMINPRQSVKPELRRHDPVMYPSGGSWGGCEDPRMVNIDGTIYVTFSAFDGWDFIRIAAISISEEDFLAKRWKWSRPLLLSPAGKVNKNWVLFPEKIKGKFAVLHSISPEVQIDYVDRLEDLSNGKQSIHSKFGGAKSRSEWDTWVRGAGPPPLRTDAGWLVLYHAIEKHEPDKYKVGAMLLDLKDPTKVIARAPAPILIPDCWYENDWKPGVVYACGATIEGDTLNVYYGGGDKHVCVAHMPLQKLLSWMKDTKKTPVKRIAKIKV